MQYFEKMEQMQKKNPQWTKYQNFKYRQISNGAKPHWSQRQRKKSVIVILLIMDLGGAFFLIKKFCTGTLFVLIIEFLAHPCIWCPRRYLTHLPPVLVLPQPLHRPHLGRLHSICSELKPEIWDPLWLLSFPLLIFHAHLKASLKTVLFFPSSLPQWGSLRGLPLADRNGFLDFPASSALCYNTRQCVPQTP